MDPEETLRAAFRALEAGDKPAAREFLGYYSDWRSRGGFEPKEGDARAIAMQKQLRSRKRAKKYGPVGPKISVRRVPLNQGGYEYGKYGKYYGNVPGESLYRYEAADWDEGEDYAASMREWAHRSPVEGELRARSRAEAKKKIRARVPGARMRGLGALVRDHDGRYGVGHAGGFKSADRFWDRAEAARFDELVKKYGSFEMARRVFRSEQALTTREGEHESPILRGLGERRRSRKCKYGKITRGVRKGQCRKKRR